MCNTRYPECNVVEDNQAQGLLSDIEVIIYYVQESKKNSDLALAELFEH